MEVLMRLLKRKSISEKEKFFQQHSGLILQKLSQREGYTNAVKTFTEKELKNATNNYNENRIIGQGALGIVYKGFLNDNRVVAIKKSEMVGGSKIELFIHEVVVITQIKHKNAVRLLGCCLETEIPILVYEFINNGSLFYHLHDATKAFALSWDTRLRIAAETARVLSYLHSIFLIHRNVKSINILLDSNYTAKLCAFSLSVLIPPDQTELEEMVQGTFGYVDPEYYLSSQLTMKSDVYSFGVVLAELLTGQRAVNFGAPEEERHLPTHFIYSLKEGYLFRLLDDHIVCKENTEQLEEVAKLAARCLKLKGVDRPTMEEVAMALEGLRIERRVKTKLNSEETESCSVKDLMPTCDRTGFVNDACIAMVSYDIQ